MSLEIARAHKQRAYQLWSELQKEMGAWEQNLPADYVKQKTQISTNLAQISTNMKALEYICAGLHQC